MKEKKNHHPQLKDGLTLLGAKFFQTSKNTDIERIFNYSENSKGDRVTNKLDFMTWYCPIKYNQLHIKSLCLHGWHSDSTTELLRVQLGLNGQGKEEARTIRNPIILETQPVKLMLITQRLENCTFHLDMF